ncbi:glycosyltransferase [Bifidobacterium eulemuris]|uniref:Glycosyl transferase family 2 n=1 Tax=Bifidobacterium eulemuris TaxID=1765219 RepID=A0A261GBI8_9BIFI|nr:glycosyltransferase [Bifidobacterium eulemuris]OZG68535.1 Glycosyl transferase family 2 [Bifidobacterium eulemuris]QOL32665.1 glycosyltransferase [Bifidobacterium eulemuris]
MFNYCIVIVTFNRLSLLRECLEHSIEQITRPSSIVVIDNCSTDGTREFLDEFSKTVCDIHIHHMKENIGGAGGFKRGLQAAIEETDADWFMLIDDDAILDYDCMSQLVPSFDKQIHAYACVVRTDDEIITMHRRRNDSPVSISEYSLPSFNCDLASFCGLMISRLLVSKIGYPQEDYFIWFDDTEYSMRFKQITPIVVRTDAVLNHKINRRSDKEEINVISWKNYYGTRNCIHAYKKHKQWSKFRKAIYFTVKEIFCQIAKGNVSAVKLYCSALFDAVVNRMGKNSHYLPGVKY